VTIFLKVGRGGETRNFAVLLTAVVGTQRNARKLECIVISEFFKGSRDV